MSAIPRSGVVEAPRSWRDIPDCGAVYARCPSGAVVRMEWRPVKTGGTGTGVLLSMRRVRQDDLKLTGRFVWHLDRADAKTRLLGWIRERWDPCVYPIGFPFEEGS
ncbi:hypothetical protein GCM10023224_31720 [Streptomonospora halophila]|uniref:Activator of Hsp90 ATPase homolog 1-like protein n=1 Tax=Streptomonospora halophila TaxID=427369 RepID=A0ABP9GNH7_9ACTN